MAYRTRIRQVSAAARGRGGLEFVVEGYLPGAGWLPLADATGRKERRFLSRRSARAWAGVIESRTLLLGAEHLR